MKLYNRAPLKLFSCLIFVFLNLNLLFAQISQLEGKVVDSENNPIPFASVFVENTNIGTLTNEDGDFFIRLQDEGSIILIVNHISFKRARIEIKIVETKIRIKLQPAIKILDEVKVSLRGLNTMKMAYSKIINSEKEYSSSGFYRQITVENDDAISGVLESYYVLNMNSIKNIEKYNLVNGRYGLLKRDSTDFGFNFSNFKSLPLGFSNATKKVSKGKHILFPMLPKMGEKYNFTISEIIQNGESEIFKILCTPKDNTPIAFQGVYYIENETFNLIRVEGEVIGDIGLNSEKNGWKFNNNGFSIIVNYRQNKDFYIPEYIRVKADTKVTYKNKTKTFETVGTLFYYGYSDFRIRKGKKPSIKTHDLKEVAKSKYDHIFWEKHNPLKYTLKEEKAVKMFDKNNYFGTYFDE